MAVRTSHVLRTSKSPLRWMVGPSVMISTAAAPSSGAEIPRLVTPTMTPDPPDRLRRRGEKFRRVVSGACGTRVPRGLGGHARSRPDYAPVHGQPHPDLH